MRLHWAVLVQRYVHVCACMCACMYVCTRVYYMQSVSLYYNSFPTHAKLYVQVHVPVHVHVYLYMYAYHMLKFRYILCTMLILIL